MRMAKGMRARAGGQKRIGTASGVRPEKLADFLEASYALELEDDPWLRGVSAATLAVWGRPAGTFASLYDASNNDFRPALVVSEGIDDALAQVFFGSVAHMTPATVARVFRRFTAGTLLQSAPELAPSLAEAQRFGLGDSFAIVGSDPNGLGCSVSFTLPAPYKPEAAELALFQRMALHLGAAYRCLGACEQRRWATRWTRPLEPKPC
jgi:hypothetical protein